jgi:hypothetical protein
MQRIYIISINLNRVSVRKEINHLEHNQKSSTEIKTLNFKLQPDFLSVFGKPLPLLLAHAATSGSPRVVCNNNKRAYCAEKHFLIVYNQKISADNYFITDRRETIPERKDLCQFKATW